MLKGLTGALGDQAQGVRREAAYALGTIGPEAKDSETALHKELEDPRVTVRVTARIALWRITGREDQVRNGLAEASDHEDAALQAFMWLSSAGRPALRVLIGELKHRRARVRSLAAFALAELRPPAREAIPDLIVVLAIPTRRCRAWPRTVSDSSAPRPGRPCRH